MVSEAEKAKTRPGTTERAKMKQTDKQEKMIRIMLADDHLVIREGLVTVLGGESDFEFVGFAEDGEQTCEEYARLTERELAVLRLMCDGKSNKEIGSKLFITEGTVKTHVKSIFYKLDVISRSEAVSAAIRKGLVRGHG